MKAHAGCADLLNEIRAIPPGNGSYQEANALAQQYNAFCLGGVPRGLAPIGTGLIGAGVVGVLGALLQEGANNPAVPQQYDQLAPGINSGLSVAPPPAVPMPSSVDTTNCNPFSSCQAGQGNRSVEAVKIGAASVPVLSVPQAAPTSSESASSKATQPQCPSGQAWFDGSCQSIGHIASPTVARNPNASNDEYPTPNLQPTFVQLNNVVSIPMYKPEQ